MTKRKSLPRKPSELLALALKDLAAVERSRKYQVNMHFWHDPKALDSGKCAVCLAGVVLAKSLGYTPDEDTYPSLQPEKIAHQLIALDYMRNGEIQSATELLGYKKAPGDREIVPYEDNPREFKRQMRQLIKDYKEIGQ